MILRSSLEGLAVSTLRLEYTCILSALIISPLSIFASFVAKEDLPIAVGPTIKIRGNDKLLFKFNCYPKGYFISNYF